MFAEIAAALGHGEPVALLTVVRVRSAAPCPPGSKLLVRADGSLIGSFGGATTDARAREDGLRAIAAAQAEIHTYHLDPAGGSVTAVARHGRCSGAAAPPRPLVASSGYVAQARWRGWRPPRLAVTLLDDRPNSCARPRARRCHDGGGRAQGCSRATAPTR
jgi:xanthine dehydrogenase accessory factor